MPVLGGRLALNPCIVSAWGVADLSVVRSFLLVLMVLVPVTVRAADPIDTRILELDRALIVAGAPNRAEQLAAAYDEWKNRNSLGASCASLSDAVLHESFRAGARVARYLGDTASLRDLECPYLQLVRRRIASADEHLGMHGALIQNRQFDKANALAKRERLSVAKLPQIKGANGDKQGVLQASKDGGVEWHPWIYSGGDEVVAYVSPSCGFSRTAMKSISEEPEWAWIRPKIRFVVRRAPVWPYPGVNEWNETNPSLPMQNQAGAAGWHSLDVLETPVFHIVRDGVVIKTISGWENSGAELAAMQEYFREGN